jgi:hypothetical protein
MLQFLAELFGLTVEVGIRRPAPRTQIGPRAIPVFSIGLRWLQNVVGPLESGEDEEPFEEKMGRLVAELERQFAEARELEAAIRINLRRLADG